MCKPPPLLVQHLYKLIFSLLAHFHLLSDLQCDIFLEPIFPVNGFFAPLMSFLVLPHAAAPTLVLTPRVLLEALIRSLVHLCQ